MYTRCDNQFYSFLKDIGMQKIIDLSIKKDNQYCTIEKEDMPNFERARGVIRNFDKMCRMLKYWILFRREKVEKNIPLTDYYNRNKKELGHCSYTHCLTTFSLFDRFQAEDVLGYVFARSLAFKNSEVKINYESIKQIDSIIKTWIKGDMKIPIATLLTNQPEKITSLEIQLEEVTNQIDIIRRKEIEKLKLESQFWKESLSLLELAEYIGWDVKISIKREHLK